MKIYRVGLRRMCEDDYYDEFSDYAVKYFKDPDKAEAYAQRLAKDHSIYFDDYPIFHVQNVDVIIDEQALQDYLEETDDDWIEAYVFIEECTLED